MVRYARSPSINATELIGVVDSQSACIAVSLSCPSCWRRLSSRSWQSNQEDGPFHPCPVGARDSVRS